MDNTVVLRKAPAITSSRPSASFPVAPVAWLLFVAIAALTAGFWPVPEPDSMDWNHLKAPPGTIGKMVLMNGPSDGTAVDYVYLLGTDTMGRDMLSRLIYGARVSLAAGLLAPCLGLLFGGTLGLAAGYRRGRLDSVAGAMMDAILAFPSIVLLLAMAFYLGPGVRNLIIALGMLTSPTFFRVVRANTLRFVDREFVLAARMLGRRDMEILFREILPNAALPVLAYALLVVAYMIVAEGIMSFLGLGVPAPTPSWGGMISAGREVLGEAPHVSLIPAGVMFLTVLSFNLLGGALRRRLERRESNL